MKIAGGTMDLSFFKSVLKRFFPVFIILLTVNVTAQEEGAKVYHLDGPEFALTVRGERSVYSARALAEAARNGGINLERAGIIHTGAATFLELQLIPSGTVIKLSENTSLVYNGIDDAGGFVDLGLLYGRIRIVTGNGRGAGSVVIRSGGISARTEEGDLGFDYILDPGDRNSIPRPLFRLHDFRGSAEVFPFGRGGPQPYFGGAQALSAEEGESLSLDISSSYTFAEKKPLSEETVNYWLHYNFAGISPLPMPPTGITLAKEANTQLEATQYIAQEVPPPAPAVVPVTVPVYDASVFVPFDPETGGQKLPTMTNNRNKNICLAVGLFLTLSSAAVQGVMYYKYDMSNARWADNVFTAMQVPLGVGLLTTLGGILYNPSLSRK